MKVAYGHLQVNIILIFFNIYFIFILTNILTFNFCFTFILYLLYILIIVSKNEKNIISGGSDSLLVIWKDVTEEKKIKAATELEQLALEEQKLANLLKADKLTSALKIALKLERPFQVLKIIESKLQSQLLTSII